MSGEPATGGRPATGGDDPGSTSTAIVEPNTRRTRLDDWLLGRNPRLGKRSLVAQIARGRVLVNGVPAPPGTILLAGDRVESDLETEAEGPFVPTPIPLHVLHEDEDLLVVNKPAGLLVHPCPGERRNTLLNAVAALAHAEGRPDRRHHLANRLDRDTSGIVLLARSDRARRSLARQFRIGAVEKRYRAILAGAPVPRVGRWEEPIGRSRTEWPRWNVRAEGRPALTEYEVEGPFDGEIAGRWILAPPFASNRFPGPAGADKEHTDPAQKEERDRSAFVRALLRPLTGRTHQIRIHAAHHGTPIVGDPVYGRGPVAGGTQLHAFRIAFRHPRDHSLVELEATCTPSSRELVLPLLPDGDAPSR